MAGTRRWSARRLALVLAAAGLLAASCGDDGDSAASTATGTSGASATASAGTPRSGGSLSIADKAEIATMDPVKLTGSSSVGANHAYAVFDSLLANDPKTGNAVPQLAEGFTSTDGKEWTLKLRPNVKFTDGTPLDAEAVAFNWKRLQDPANSSPSRGSASQITAMQVVDATTLRVTLGAPNAGFANLLVDRLGFIGSPTAIQANPTGFGSKPVGAGPFVLKEWIRDDRMTLVKNTSYWNAPKPYLDELVFRVIVDGTQRQRAFESKEISLNRTTAPQDIGAAKRFKAEVTSFNSNLGMSIVLNHRQAPFNDASVRKAMNLALDPKNFNTVLNDDAGEMMTSLFAPGSPWRVDAAKLPTYNKAEAQKLFDAYKTKNGSALSFKLSVFQNPESRMIGEYVQAQLTGYGVKVDLDVGQSAAVVDAVSKGNFAAVHWSFPVGPDPEPLVYDSFYSKSATNRFGYVNAEVDAALDKGRATVDPAERKKAYQTAQEIIIRDDVSLWLYHQTTAYIHRAEVKDIALSGDGIFLSDRVWVSA